MKFLVFGLGNFGASLAQKLVALGHEVIGVDRKLEIADKYKHAITHTVALDSTSKESVEQLPVKDMDAVIVGMGEDEGATIMTTALLKQMNAGRIVCRVTSPLQKIVLEAMDIKEFVYPEESSAERLALTLDLPGVLESFHITHNYRLLEIDVPDRYIGYSTDQLSIQERYNLTLVTIIKNVRKKNIFGGSSRDLQVMGTVPPGTILKDGDILLLFGSTADFERFIEGR